MNLDVYNTHMELYPYIKDDLPVIEKMYTATDRFSGSEYPCGYMIEDGKLYLPRGTSVSRIENICGIKANYINESDPIERMERKHYGIYDPRDDLQRESIKFLKGSEHQLGLNLRTGYGKAEPLSTKIPTPNGYKYMGDLKIGDKVFGSNGNPIKVIGVYPQGVKDVYEITFSDGRKSRCCKEHLWNAYIFEGNTSSSGISSSYEFKTAELSYLISMMNLGYIIKIPAMVNAEIKDGIIKYDYISLLKICSITLVSKEECQCIMVDSDDHLYVTKDFIITHNTFCVASASTELNERTIIITPNEALKQQWISTYTKMFDYRPKQLINIAGSNIIDAIMNDMVEYADVYFVNHQTLRNYITSNNGYMLHKFFKKIAVGIKVYDESHMEFGNILLLDFFSNTNRTWYLTATFDRSDKTESACFKRAFSSVIEYGYMESNRLAEKHVIYHVVSINSRISPKDRASLMGYPGFTGASYGRYAFLKDPNNTAYNTILKILGILENVEGKILIFVPLIEAVDKVVDKLKKNYPNKSVAAYHSKISKDEKESAEKKDIIVSTIKSLGTGKDIKGLRAVINLEPIASKVIAEQMFGRIRPYVSINKDGEEKTKETYFFDIIDICIAPCNYFHRARFKKIESLAKKVVYLNIDN